MKKIPYLPIVDNNGLLQIPQRFYWLLLVLLRPYVCWILVLTMPQQQQDVIRLFYPEQSDFVLACLLASPVLLLAITLNQRKATAHAIWKKYWRSGRWLLLVVSLVDLALTLYVMPATAILDTPWQLLVPIALVVAILWLCRSRSLPVIFTEWPEAIDKSGKLAK